ncbi:short-chain dehydrogenase [Diplodia corticola]|uniref:Short-chain dehydrogenase n=1 Tax=Diplodia corticola TaxID=236234 RepID=A0A1J9RK09_9PEZI|nr:short-chain dehydrogenase [Diplodia corticola]OJD28855.1 short-chain dehydrogenase [Diplodia corticola]
MPSPRQAPKLSTQTVLVIGGTSGIGLAVAAEALAQSAQHVTIAGSNPAKLSAALSTLRAGISDGSHQRISGHTCDLLGNGDDDNDIETNLRALLDATVATNGAGRIDHVAYTAGDAAALAALTTPAAALTVDAIRAGGTVRFVGPLLLAKLLPAYVRRSPPAADGDGDGDGWRYHSPSLTLTGGVNATRPAPGWTVAAAYGAALRGAVRGLAVDLAGVPPCGIRVNLVEPGAVETPLWDGVAPGGGREAMRRRFAERSTVGRVGRPEDTAEAYVYLMKDGFAAGAVVESNGGTLLV